VKRRPAAVTRYAPAARLHQLRAMLDAAGGVSIYDVAERLGVNPRTALRYVQALLRAGEPLYEELVGKRKAWRLMPTARRQSITLTTAQMVALFLSRRVFDFLAGTGKLPLKEVIGEPFHHPQVFEETADTLARRFRHHPGVASGHWPEGVFIEPEVKPEHLLVERLQGIRSRRFRCFLLQATWTLFFTSPVVESTNSRGNLRGGADRISETTLRSTSLFVRGAAVDTAVTGEAVVVLSVSVTIRTATCAASWPPPRATRSATRNPFAARLHNRAAGRRRRLAKVDASRHCDRRGTVSATGGG